MRAQELMSTHERTGQPGVLDAGVAAWNAVLAHPVLPSAPVETRATVLVHAGVARYTRSRVPLGTRRNPLAHADLDAAVRVPA